MKNKLKEITTRWIETNSYPVDGFSTRTIAKYNKEDIVLIGMRRTGKTEYLKYRYKLLNSEEHVELENTNDLSISPNNELLNTIFLNFDDPIFSTTDFKSIESKSFQNISDGIEELINEENISLILIDEIQRRTNWTRWLKGFKDKYPFITFVATGSDATEMLKGNEFGGGRFKVVYVGIYSYHDYLKGANVMDRTFLDYVDNNFLPSRVLSADYELQFSQIIEKQMQSRKITREIISSVIKYISFFPGINLNPSRIARSISDDEGTKLDAKQVKVTLEFLIESQLIFKIESNKGKNQIKTRSSFRYYPSNFNTYRYFTTSRQFRNPLTDPLRYGLIFENIIISNIYSSLGSELERQKITFSEFGKDDVDFTFSGKNVEIKSYDLFDKGNKEFAEEGISKMKGIKNPIIIHTGNTKKENGIEFINFIEFLKEELWKTW